MSSSSEVEDLPDDLAIQLSPEDQRIVEHLREVGGDYALTLWSAYSLSLRMIENSHVSGEDSVENHEYVEFMTHQRNTIRQTLVNYLNYFV